MPTDDFFTEQKLQSRIKAEIVQNISGLGRK
jgi:hypothetical protein